MEPIAGVGNWNITYRTDGHSVTILRAVTCDWDAILPEEIQGQPVTALGDYALAAREKKLADPSEEIHHVEIRNYRNLPGVDAEWNNLPIKSLCLPNSLMVIGHYAFLGLRSLEQMELPDNPIRWGMEPLMNCLRLHDIVLNRQGDEQDTLAILCRDLPGELDVTIQGMSTDTIRLLFPAYTEIAEENTPARQLDLSMDGIGYPYHHVLRNRRLVLPDYDALWNSTKGRGGDIQETLLVLAWYRLRYPVKLEARFQKEYQDYLQSRKEALLDWVMEHGDGADLRFLLKQFDLPEKALEQAAGIAREAGNTQAVAELLEGFQGQRAPKELPKGRRKSFDL